MRRGRDNVFMLTGGWRSAAWTGHVAVASTDTECPRKRVRGFYNCDLTPQGTKPFSLVYCPHRRSWRRRRPRLVSLTSGVSSPNNSDPPKRRVVAAATAAEFAEVAAVADNTSMVSISTLWLLRLVVTFALLLLLWRLLRLPGACKKPGAAVPTGWRVHIVAAAETVATAWIIDYAAAAAEIAAAALRLHTSTPAAAAATPEVVAAARRLSNTPSPHLCAQTPSQRRVRANPPTGQQSQIRPPLNARASNVLTVWSVLEVLHLRTCDAGLKQTNPLFHVIQTRTRRGRVSTRATSRSHLCICNAGNTKIPRSGTSEEQLGILIPLPRDTPNDFSKWILSPLPFTEYQTIRAFHFPSTDPAA